MLSKTEDTKEKLNFEVSANKAKIMALLGVLSAASPALAKKSDPTSPKSTETGLTEIPRPVSTEDDPVKWSEALTPEQAQEWMTHTNPADALSVEKLADLSDIIPTGAPEVSKESEPWKQEVMRNHMLKTEGGGNYSFFAGEVNGQKKIFAMTASHVLGNLPVGTTGNIGGDLFGFPTNGGSVFFEVTVVGSNIGPGDPNSVDNKFTVLEINRYWGIDGGELDAGVNDYKTLRVFPLAEVPIDTTNPGYIGNFTQSGNWIGGGFPNYDPNLVGKFVAPVNLDPTGDQDPLTNMKVGETGTEGETIATIPMEVFHQDSANIGPGSSGGDIGQVFDPNLTPADMRNKGADNFLTKDIIEDYKILGPVQGSSVPLVNGEVFRQRLTLVQPYRSQIEQAIGGGTLLDTAPVIWRSVGPGMSERSVRSSISSPP